MNKKIALIGSGDHFLGCLRETAYTDSAEAPVRVRGIVDATDEDMTIINTVAAESLRSEDVYVFSAVVSTDALDTYWTRMAESSLRNYVQDAQAGNPLMTGHDITKLPLGRSFMGRLETVDGLLGVTLRDYMLRGHEISGQKTDEIAKAIRAGTLSDFSIFFGGPDRWYRCGICNRDIFDSECPHVPGVLYDGVRAFAWVEDAHMIEHSLVYRGSTPGAAMRKARSMAEAGRLSSTDIKFLEDSWKCRLLDNKRLINLPPKKGEKAGKEMNARQFLAALGARLRAVLTDDMARLFGLKLDDVRATLPEDATVEDAMSQITDALRSVSTEAQEAALKPFRDLGINSVEDVRSLQTQAELGNKYRSDLIDGALAEGVRAYGDKFDKDRYQRTLDAGTIDDIKSFRSEWTEAAKARLGESGRQTKEADPNAAPAAGGEQRDTAKEVDDFLKRTA